MIAHCQDIVATDDSLQFIHTFKKIILLGTCPVEATKDNSFSLSPTLSCVPPAV